MAPFLTIVFAVCLINGSLIGFSEQVRGKPASNGNLPYDDFLFPLVWIRFFQRPIFMSIQFTIRKWLRMPTCLLSSRTRSKSRHSIKWLCKNDSTIIRNYCKKNPFIWSKRFFIPSPWLWTASRNFLYDFDFGLFKKLNWFVMRGLFPFDFFRNVCFFVSRFSLVYFFSFVLFLYLAFIRGLVISFKKRWLNFFCTFYFQYFAFDWIEIDGDVGDVS